MRIQKTSISETEDHHVVVEMVIADYAADPAQALEHLSFRVRISHGENPLLAEVQAKALRRARDLVAEEMHKTSSRADLPRE